MLSVIIPAYNEEKQIAETIRALTDILSRKDFDFELVVVSDGSRDRTFEVAKELEDEKVKVFSYTPNRGKGHALRFGFERSRGEYVAFFDAGMDFPPSQILEFLERLKETGADLVIGSKRHPGSRVIYPWHRRLVSLGAQLTVKALFNLNITDTQVGLKVFRREVLGKVMPLVLVKRYAFDIELLALARHYGFKIVEAPVNLELKFGTAVSPKSLARTLADTLAVFYRFRILGFYDLPREERDYLIANYPVTLSDKFLTRILGDFLTREGPVREFDRPDEAAFVSIIIPVERVNENLRECLARLAVLDYPNYEILVFSTEGTTEEFPGVRFVVDPQLAGRPAAKRDLALKYAKGEILAFIDDDVYPRSDWLKNAVGYFQDSEVGAVCGPGVTPESDSTLQKASGWVSASLLGGGPGAYYRFRPGKKREVDDYPTMNLLVRRSDFAELGGFDSRFWPGEDTKFCLDLTRKLRKRIIYDPDILVYHHRRPLFVPHLKQNGRYGLHRGHFARILPETSCRLSYFIPSLFTLFFFLTPLLALLLRPHSHPLYFWLNTVYYLLNTIYFVLLLLTAVWVYAKERDWRVALLVIPGIFLTHIWYGLRFLQGFFSPRLTR